MKNIIKILVANVLLVGSMASIHGQHLVHPLTVSLTAYDNANNQTIKIKTSQLIEWLVGEPVPQGKLYLITPVGQPPGTTDNLNAFLRITSGSNIVMEVSTPEQFNLFQVVSSVKTNGNRTSAKAINRFSINTSRVRSELQGISNWSYFRRQVAGVEISGAATFQSQVNGWIIVSSIVETALPVNGTIVSGSPVLGP